MSPLSPRERDVLQMTWDGLTLKETAQSLGVSPHRVKNIRYQIAEKFGVRTSMQMVRHALKQGLIGLP